MCVGFLKCLIRSTWEISIFTFYLASFICMYTYIYICKTYIYLSLYKNISKVWVTFGLSNCNGGEQASFEATLVLSGNKFHVKPHTHVLVLSVLVKRTNIESQEIGATTHSVWVVFSSINSLASAQFLFLFISTQVKAQTIFFCLKVRLEFSLETSDQLSYLGFMELKQTYGLVSASVWPSCPAIKKHLTV